MSRLSLLVCLVLLSPPVRAEDGPYLFQKPTVNKTHIVFAFADDLWIAPRSGGDAVRLTTGPGVETDPIFSPDGKQIAFTAEYEGNFDVYLIPSEGGQPRRLTYHPGVDRAVGWSPDGKQVLISSMRESNSRVPRLFTMPVDGVLPSPLPLPMGDHGDLSPDGQFIAYVPFPPAFRIWKRYQGGRTTPIWVARLSDSTIEKIPRKNSNDFNPLWVNDKVYFLSDRDGPVTLFCWDPKSKNVRRVLENKGLDLKSASAGGGVIAYEQFGALFLFDPKTEKATPVKIRVRADLPQLRPRFVKVGRRIQNASLSPTGQRAIFEARGEILTVPVKKGDPRNLTSTPGVAERDPAWSPDGQKIAYFSDASGEYELHVCNQTGGDVKKYKLGKAPSFYYDPVWSPDGTRIAYTDKRLNVWFIDLASGKSTLVDTSTYSPRPAAPVWSPDSKWLAYARKLKNHLNAVFLYSLESGKSHQITDGRSDARNPAFDRGGQYLYFTASTDAGRGMGGIEMSNFDYPASYNVYLVVLRKDASSPLAPESDEEKNEPRKDPREGPREPPKKKPVEVKIDLEDIDQRILALPIPARNYAALAAGKPGVLFLYESAGLIAAMRGESRSTLHKFELDRRRVEKFAENITAAVLSFDGEKLLLRTGGAGGRRGGGEGDAAPAAWAVVSTAAPPKPGEGTLRLDNLEVKVDPRAEWKQMYNEVWRLQRDFLYDPTFHGLDLQATARKYEPYLTNLASRRDLNYLFGEMLGELSLGHVYVQGGDTPETPRVRGGLLGADWSIERGRYRFARVYRGENWNPALRAPLTQPGVNVKAGEFLLAINARPVTASDNIYRLLEGTAGKSVVLKVGPDPDGKNAREVTVVPIDDEFALRNRAWVEDNRRKVEKLSNGRVAYVYLSNTSVEGFTQFNRSFFAQADKEGVVIDERFNGGGKAADYIIMRLAMPLMNYWTTREGETYSTPAGQIFGPKAMIINEMAGSGGDWLPWMFRRARLGPLVGKRTWGGLVGIGGYPALIDGGTVTAPHFAFWNPEGEWEVENHGVAPDYEVELDPAAVRAGRDPQLEKAVELVLAELAKNPVKKPRPPAFPNYHRKQAAAQPTPENEALWDAARRGDVKAVQAALDRGADVNAQTDYGATALSFAADKGHVEVVRLLIQRKADVNLRDKFYGATPLTWASSRGHAAVVGLLLEAGASGADALLVSSARQGETALVKAALAHARFKPETLTTALKAAEKAEIVELLRKAGARLPERPSKPAIDLKPYAGTYKNERGELTITVKGDSLLLSASGRTLFSLVHEKDDTFRAEGAEATVTFHKKNGQATSFVLKAGNNPESTLERVVAGADTTPKPPAVVKEVEGVVQRPANWPQFRGIAASGNADGQLPPTTFDVPRGKNVRWKTPIPGLGHSCPVVWGHRVFVTTAISGDTRASIKPGQYGNVDSLEDASEHVWKVFCLDKQSGKVLWERTAHRGVPRCKRHPKSTQANPTPATDGTHLVACFGAEGLYCYDLAGKLLWKQHLGDLEAGWFYDPSYQWGFGSSPILYRDRVIVQCDVGKGSFIAAYRLSDGKELWRTPRQEIPSWGTPTLVQGPKRAEIVTNATKFARGYDPETGKELWRLGNHSEITVPTPIYAEGLIFVCSGYRPIQPIYAIRPGATGDISLKGKETSNASVAWSSTRGGPYMPTPIVYAGHLYVCTNAGILSCYEAKTGKKLYSERLGGEGGYTASPVAADGRLYFTSELGGIRVVRAGPKFELLAVNPLGETCLSTPAIADGLLIVRTEKHLIALARPEKR